MSQQNIEIVRRAFDELDLRDLRADDPALAMFFHPEIEWHAAAPSLLAATTHHG